jgi:hypothetical protein
MEEVVRGILCASVCGGRLGLLGSVEGAFGTVSHAATTAQARTR